MPCKELVNGWVGGIRTRLRERGEKVTAFIVTLDLVVNVV